MSKTSDLKYRLEVFFLREGDKIVAYVPALDLSTCADTLAGAKKRANEAIDIFFEETIEHGTLDEALHELGWHVQKKQGRPRWVPPEVVAQRSVDVRVPLLA